MSTLYQNTAHGLSGDGEKVRPVARLHTRVIHQAKIRFIDQGRSLQCVAGALTAHLAVGQSPQFLIDKGNHTVGRRFVAVAPVEEQARNVLLVGFGHLLPLVCWGKPRRVTRIIASPASLLSAAHPILKISARQKILWGMRWDFVIVFAEPGEDNIK
jgi:hypothetical protein